ncbi:hypothetical protein FQN54_005539 [Arachnomyces sp. PD_36]|nr:hypothetical protein FQN54_005539 [Arachnomyces sp. PD_36]
MEGRCQCHHIKFTTPLPAPLKVYICHCTQCRAQSSSTYGLTAIFPTFTIPNPSEPAELPIAGTSSTEPPGIGTFTRTTLSGKKLECLFCRRCGVRLMHRPVGGEFLSVKAGCLVGFGREMVARAEHIWCGEAVVDIPERDGEGREVVRWEGEPDEGSLS